MSFGEERESPSEMHFKPMRSKYKGVLEIVLGQKRLSGLNVAVGAIAVELDHQVLSIVVPTGRGGGGGGGGGGGDV